MRDGFLTLRDSLHTIDVASARIQRDMHTASDAVLASRARMVRDGCARSNRTLPGARSEMLSIGMQAPAERRARLQERFETLQATLAKCASDFEAWSSPAQAEEVRGYAVARIIRVQDVLRGYEGEAQFYLKSIGIKVRPLYAGPSPLAGSVNQP